MLRNGPDWPLAKMAGAIKKQARESERAKRERAHHAVKIYLERGDAFDRVSALDREDVARALTVVTKVAR